MRGKGIAKDKSGSSGADPASSKSSCGRQCVCERKARLAYKHAVSQEISEQDAANAIVSNPPNHELATNSNTSKNISQKIQNVVYTENLDDVVKFVEGNATANKKKRLKKERQKLERQETVKQQQQQEERLKEAMAKKQERIQDEKRQEESQIGQLSKKQIKKASQKKKLLAEQENHSQLSKASSMPQVIMPKLSSPSGNIMSNPLSSLQDLKTELNNLTSNFMNRPMGGLLKPSPSTCSNYNYSPSVPSDMLSGRSLDQGLEALKAQHQRELEMLQLKHRQALEEEEMKAMHKQKEQLYMRQLNQSPQNSMLQCQPQTYQPSRSISPLAKPSQRNLQQNKKCNNNSSKTVENTRFLEANPHTIPAAATEALATVEKNPGNQIRISRNAKGGVDFNAIPADQIKLLTQTFSAKSTKSDSATQSLNSTSGVPDMFNRKMTLETKQNPKEPATNKGSNIKSSKSDQAMVTIRRVENPYSNEPAVTISQTKKSVGNSKEKDTLLYTLVNGQVLKAKDAPNLIPGAKPMPPNMFQQAT